MAYFTLFGPGIPTEGSAFQLGESEFTLGRDPASSLVLDDRKLSRRHAVIRRGPSGWEIHDLGSSNGIRVQGHRLDSALLSDGDEIRLGPFVLVFSGDRVARSTADPSCATASSCGSPSGDRPRSAPCPPFASSPEGRPGLLVAGLAAAVLLPSILAGVAVLSSRKASRTEAAPTATTPPEPTPAAPLLPDEPLPPRSAWPPPPDPVVEAEVDRAAASLEAAFRAGNVDEVFVHVHPAATESLRAAFGPRAAELPRVAVLLATRKLVVAEEAWAEYEVTEDGRAFAVVFEKVEGRWLLSSL